MKRIMRVQLISKKHQDRCPVTGCGAALKFIEFELAMYSKKKKIEYKKAILRYCWACDYCYINHIELKQLNELSEYKVRLKDNPKLIRIPKAKANKTENRNFKPDHSCIVEPQTHGDHILIMCMKCKQCFEFTYGEHCFYVRIHKKYPSFCDDCKRSEKSKYYGIRSTM